MNRGLLLIALVLTACPGAPAPLPERVALKRVSGTTFELIPTAGQYPSCLVFTVSAGGVIRQLTMSRDNTSFTCPAGKPIGSHSYRVPLEEGAVKIHVLFSTQLVNAASVAQQLLELKERTQIAPIDLRLPGSVTIDTLAFTPEAEAPPTVGGVVGQGGLPDSDAGAP